MSQFTDIVPDCEASFKTYYLAFKIFEFLKMNKTVFKTKELTALPKLGNVCYRKKSINTKKFIEGLSEELKNALNEPIINYSSLFEPQIIKDVDGLAVSPYPKVKKNDIKKMKIYDLLQMYLNHTR